MFAFTGGAVFAQVVSLPMTVVVEPQAPAVRVATVVADGPNTALRVPTVLFRCNGDLNADGETDLSDLNIVLAAFGCTAPEGAPLGTCSGDLNFDGETNLADLNILLGAFGQDCL